MILYTDINPFCCRALDKLVDRRLLPVGDVWEGDIRGLHGLERLTQIHFFCGIGGWPLALNLVRWPNDLPIWTGSCPCQPFSVSGEQHGTKDHRDLWPDFFSLIDQYHPPLVMGEQVTGEAGLIWLDRVVVDMEKAGYEVRAVELAACAVGAPHIRPRIYWLAYSKDAGLQRPLRTFARSHFSSQSASAELYSGRLRAGFYPRATPTIIRPLDGLSNLVDFVSAIGNAIVPQVAAAFIATFLESLAQEQEP
jgi:DNA (cytosine-5)-methyltransferase 1